MKFCCLGACISVKTYWRFSSTLLGVAEVWGSRALPISGMANWSRAGATGPLLSARGDIWGDFFLYFAVVWDCLSGFFASFFGFFTVTSFCFFLSSPFFGYLLIGLLFILSRGLCLLYFLPVLGFFACMGIP